MFGGGCQQPTQQKKNYSLNVNFFIKNENGPLTLSSHICDKRILESDHLKVYIHLRSKML